MGPDEELDRAVVGGWGGNGGRGGGCGVHLRKEGRRRAGASADYGDLIECENGVLGRVLRVAKVSEREGVTAKAIMNMGPEPGFQSRGF